jgi:hypothetical protein
MSDSLLSAGAVSAVALLGKRTESCIENLHVGLGTGHGGAGLGVADFGLKKFLLQLREFVGGGRGAWQS